MEGFEDLWNRSEEEAFGVRVRYAGKKGARLCEVHAHELQQAVRRYGGELRARRKVVGEPGSYLGRPICDVQLRHLGAGAFFLRKA